jgi:hypothetical protein
MRRLLVLLLLAGLPAMAGTIGVQWDPVTHPDLTGYKVYSGGAAGDYSQTLTTVNTQANVPVNDCSAYFVAVKAVAATTDPEDDDGIMESNDFSNEISGWGAPQVSTGVPRAIKTNKVVPFAVHGLNFQSGATVVVAGATVTDVQVVDCRVISATIDPRGSPAGEAMVTVENPDGTFGAANAVLFYQGPAPPPDVMNLRK